MRWDPQSVTNVGAIGPLAAALAYREKIRNGEKKDIPWDALRE
ncbi:MAG: hypothetical protein UY98_C0023G0006 [Candidatus Kaiserbacteria bacterium GW2011_GWA2_58_9]|uniref:Uncharacterized protein n=1 Tax=Candidatus Kaiserbacteria bacterium GW2011_GWA2_58_9 TaxID=1618672 RepID=A0A0G1YUZ1_9BACT|nr:MAG: hypothetical protein UY98_C0023G0006 [Candidatus Kaiserbacteria bacterium GW2011_GWA2_58_9]